MATPKTESGRGTRDRITAAAPELVFERGLARTSLDAVVDRAAVSKSRLYLDVPHANRCFAR
jgi:AcrR family transcriptional regulator